MGLPHTILSYLLPLHILLAFSGCVWGLSSRLLYTQYIDSCVSTLLFPRVKNNWQCVRERMKPFNLQCCKTTFLWGLTTLIHLVYSFSVSTDVTCAFSTAACLSLHSSVGTATSLREEAWIKHPNDWSFLKFPSSNLNKQPYSSSSLCFTLTKSKV